MWQNTSSLFTCSTYTKNIFLGPLLIQVCLGTSVSTLHKQQVVMLLLSIKIHKNYVAVALKLETLKKRFIPFPSPNKQLSSLFPSPSFNKNILFILSQQDTFYKITQWPCDLGLASVHCTCIIFLCKRSFEKNVLSLSVFKFTLFQLSTKKLYILLFAGKIIIFLTIRHHHHPISFIWLVVVVTKKAVALHNYFFLFTQLTNNQQTLLTMMMSVLNSQRQ